MNNKKVQDNTNQDTRVLACVGSINFREYKHCDLPSLAEKLTNLFERWLFVENYYLIWHDDTDTPHIHYVLELTGQKRLKTLLNDFEREGYNRASINIDKLGFLNASLKYFLHQTEEAIEDGKKIYPLEAIISNLSIEALADIISLDEDVLTAERLIQICLECNTQIDVMKRLGLKCFHKHRYEVDLIYKWISTLRYKRDIAREKKEDINL